MRMRTDRMIETARNRSSRIDGSGRMRTTRMVITPTAKAMSPRLSRSPRSESCNAPNLRAGWLAALCSLIANSLNHRGLRARRLPGAGDRSAGDAAHLATARRWDGDTVGGVFIELVTQGPDRNAEDVGRMRAVAETMLEGLEDEVALHIRNGASDQRAGDLLGCERRVGHRRRLRSRIVETGAVRREDRLRADLGAGGEKHRTMDGVLKLADIARPAIDHELPAGLGRKRPLWHAVGLSIKSDEMVGEFEHVS